MISKSWCSPAAQRRANKSSRGVKMVGGSAKAFLLLWVCLIAGRGSQAGDAPAWMHTAATAPLPTHDEKTDAVIIYSEDITTVVSEGKVQDGPAAGLQDPATRRERLWHGDRRI